ncbi:hypothetical protein [Francisella tularensis]|uniref:hypothetical protein n=1 Tax=Francisella tularensis TaxID=263 RepID=UPI001C0EAE3B|nr:hypothetical protein [Francisella tularensis]MBK2110114.1 hypothetical protein [Francisella tularensis subsp. novicida FSC595]
MSKTKYLLELGQNIEPRMPKEFVDRVISDIQSILSNSDTKYTKGDAIAIFCWFYNNVCFQTKDFIHRRIADSENGAPLLFDELNSFSAYYSSIFLLTSDKYYTNSLKHFLMDLIENSDKLEISNINIEKIDYKNIYLFCLETLMKLRETEEITIMDVLSSWIKVVNIKRFGVYRSSKDYKILKELHVNVNYDKKNTYNEALVKFHVYKYPNLTPSDIFILLHHRLLAYSKWIQLAYMLEETIPMEEVKETKDIILNSTLNDFVKQLLDDPINARAYGEDHKVFWEQDKLNGSDIEKNMLRALKAPYSKKVSFYNNIASLYIEKTINPKKLKTVHEEFRYFKDDDFKKVFSKVWNENNLLKFFDAFLYKEFTNCDASIFQCVETKGYKGINYSRYVKRFREKFTFEYLSQLAFYFDKDDITIDLDNYVM